MFLAVLIIAGLAWSEYQLANQESDSRIVNISGRQRMLSQKISKVVAELAAKPDTETSTRLTAELTDALNLWERSQNALRFGDASIGITGDNSPTVNRMYSELDPIYERILSLGKIIVTLTRSDRVGSAEFFKATSEILSNENSFLMGMNNIVFTHDREASARVTKSRIIVFSVNILLLSFMIFLWFVIIRPALRKAQAIDKAKSEFISLASHQLKTPPTAIKLLTERLLGGKMGTFTDKQKEYLGDIRSSNQRMIDLVNTLLNVSRIDMGGFIIQIKEKNPDIIIQNILDELKLIIDKKQLELRAIFLEKNIMLMLDESLFRIVINNLVINAIHYTAEGGKVQIECKVVSKGQTFGGKFLEENCFMIIVSDTGYGIPQKEQSKIFTKLFRADNAREKNTDGTGLGLYIVKSILDHSGGSIWFTSRENEGSVFYVAIPMSGMRAKAGEKELVA